VARTAIVDRKTRETQIRLELALDGAGRATIQSGVGFLDHMLTLFARHGLFDLAVHAQGDLHVDDHHTVEDIGICLGSAFFEALGDKKGIVRYGHLTLPMDEALVTCAVDLSGRAECVWTVPITAEKVGSFDTQLAEDFWRAAAHNARMNYHVLLHYGRNAHHVIEAVFKASARALRQAVAIDSRAPNDVPSTKGVL
jgi:imidazoleglycerol-phosphate dehydratase